MGSYYDEFDIPSGRPRINQPDWQIPEMTCVARGEFGASRYDNSCNERVPEVGRLTFSLAFRSEHGRERRGIGLKRQNAILQRRC